MKRLVLLGLFILSSCHPQQSAPVLQPALSVDPSTAGILRGTVRFEGVPPAPTKIPVAGFSECANPKTHDDDTLIREGNVQNAFVFIKTGLEGYAFPPPAGEVVLDQAGCLYAPRVVGLRVGQPLVVRNSDPAFHNVHALPRRSRSFNLAMTKGASDIRRSFAEPEVMVPIRCDVHPWMRAYAGVLPHPAFAVTGPDGRFEIKGIPPGTYTLSVWHERLGTADQSTTLGANEEKTVTFVITSDK
jgi:hypothetical protein